MERETVSTFEPSGHLTPASVQALVDGVLEGEEARAAEAHVDACHRCRAEVEEWELLFSELRGLGRLEPRPGFADRVLAGVDVPAPEALPWAARLLGWLGLGRSRRSTEKHLGPRGFQEYLEELVPARQRARMEAHVDGCSRCSRELEAWRSLLAGLESLPTFAPSTGFAERVMARVRVGEAPAPAVRPARIAARIAGWARQVLPGTRRSWAVASGVALAPAVAAGTILFAVFSHPLLTPTSLAAFLWWKVSDLVRATGAWIFDQVIGSAVAFHAVSAVDAVTTSPMLAAGGGLLLASLMVAAAWVLYRNLISAPPVDGRYAHVSA